MAFSGPIPTVQISNNSMVNNILGGVINNAVGATLNVALSPILGEQLSGVLGLGPAMQFGSKEFIGSIISPSVISTGTQAVTSALTSAISSPDALGPFAGGIVSNILGGAINNLGNDFIRELFFGGKSGLPTRWFPGADTKDLEDANYDSVPRNPKKPDQRTKQVAYTPGSNGPDVIFSIKLAKAPAKDEADPNKSPTSGGAQTSGDGGKPSSNNGTGSEASGRVKPAASPAVSLSSPPYGSEGRYNLEQAYQNYATVTRPEDVQRLQNLGMVYKVSDSRGILTDAASELLIQNLMQLSGSDGLLSPEDLKQAAVKTLASYQKAIKSDAYNKNLGSPDIKNSNLPASEKRRLAVERVVDTEIQDFSRSFAPKVSGPATPSANPSAPPPSPTTPTSGVKESNSAANVSFAAGTSTSVGTAKTEEKKKEEDGGWKFICAPQDISWTISANVNRVSIFGTNRPPVVSGARGMRDLTMSNAIVEGFTMGKSVEGKIAKLEELLNLAFDEKKTYVKVPVYHVCANNKKYGEMNEDGGYFVIKDVKVKEEMRDLSGNTTRAVVDVSFMQVPGYQVDEGRDQATLGVVGRKSFLGSVEEKVEKNLQEQSNKLSSRPGTNATGTASQGTTPPSRQPRVGDRVGNGTAAPTSGTGSGAAPSPQSAPPPLPPNPAANPGVSSLSSQGARDQAVLATTEGERQRQAAAASYASLNPPLNNDSKVASGEGFNPAGGCQPGDKLCAW